jgi:hypothetical protein
MPWVQHWENGSEQSIEVDEFPKECPHCGLRISAEPRMSSRHNHPEFGTHVADLPELEVVFECPSPDCLHLFVGLYEAVTMEERAPFVLYRTIPLAAQTRTFDECVHDVSPSFCQIWNEAHKAEQAGLHQICGVGYRKSLEFLIKDYLIYLNPSDREEVSKAFLSNCIERRITEPRIKACAKRATWLGNDETHYLRKWVDRDISDLKKLIDLTVHWIMMEHLTESYETDMPDKKE